MNATAVAELDRGTLAAKKNAFRENLWRNVRGLENHLLACGGRVVGYYGMQMPEREAQKHERQENEKPLESHHGNSFGDAGIVQHLVSFRKKETKAIGAAPVPCIFGNKKARKSRRGGVLSYARARGAAYRRG